MTARLALTEHERSTVLAIVRRHLPRQAEVWVFGSRATGTCKPWSDLDLAIDAKEQLSLAVLACLREAFDESSLPWKVDIVDQQVTSAAFNRLINATKLALDPAE